MKYGSNENQTVLISGASIAGPALAYWLHQHGFHPTIVERAPALREGGYKIDIRGVAVEVADRMGIMDNIQRASTDMRESTFVNRANKPIATLPADFMGGRIGRDDEIMRGDLAHILYERTRDTTEYIFGDSIASMEQREDGVQVNFANGSSRHFDLVIGADGLHSRVRELTFGDESQFIRHLGGYISFCTVPNFLQLDRQEIYYGMAKKSVCVYSTRKDAEAKCIFFFNSPLLQYDYRDSRAQKQILVDKFAADGWYTPRLLESVWAAPDFYFDAISLIQMPHWSSERIALLGDAAYCASPASGQGTGLALVGAYVLAGELAEAAGDYRVAFTRYENIMRSFVAANQQFAISGSKSMIPQSQAQLWLMYTMLRTLSYMPWKGVIAKKFAEGVQQAANAITLKDYQAVAV
ncbi:FAD-dependent oxidoreductase [Ktedonosporobacter rubrisoli]|uniref:FAD-dependent oxidoreductase n=1 Tax=Ktedonosporobacter rubrisoli TaxID=2509675 RepID=A0A4P6JHV8_KTERU|nr:FAD-dependent monooxygenase [Ktedonosporobacter rubrisoli]QBD74624.1 FAD-dependent oxidoreductase [Ktedonosporobacter rubrisoli]